jgi:uncharacterized repeat protein (TIGR03803 family)
LTGTGGADNDGVLYMITKTGTFTKPRDLTCATDGCNNWAPLGQRTDGTLYGVSSQGGGVGGGTIYTLSSASYPRFIVVLNYSAASPRTIDILGNGFAGATAVTFGEVKATSFTVTSATQINTTVPTAALSGAIAVTTVGGTGSKGTFTFN